MTLQLLVAQILSACYALIMMAVIVGTALQLGEDGIGSPSAIFLIALSGSFFIAACLHPQEFWCVVPGILYLMMIPSMYLLLILYSIINLNVVSWGTREVQTKKSKKVTVLGYLRLDKPFILTELVCINRNWNGSARKRRKPLRMPRNNNPVCSAFSKMLETTRKKDPWNLASLAFSRLCAALIKRQ